MTQTSILFVEDDQDDILLFQLACKRTGIAESLNFFENGKRAVDFLKSKIQAANPDRFLMFLDLNMPEMNGFEFLEWRRGVANLRAMPVIILSTSENPQDIAKAYDLGANAYLVKSSTIADLSGMLSAAHSFWIRHNRFVNL